VGKCELRKAFKQARLAGEAGKDGKMEEMMGEAKVEESVRMGNQEKKGGS